MSCTCRRIDGDNGWREEIKDKQIKGMLNAKEEGVRM